MSRSRRKHAWVWITKPWTKLMEHRFRGKVKRALRDIEIDFDPDRDWEEANLDNKKLGEWGTKCGFSVKPHPDDSVWDKGYYEEIMRK